MQIYFVRKIIPLLTIYFLISAFVTSSVVEAKRVYFDDYRVAVFPLRSTLDLEEMASNIGHVIMANLKQKSKLFIIEKSDVDVMMGEWGLSNSELSSKENAMMMGQLLGAQIIITGRVFKVEDEITILVKIMGVENGNVYAEQEDVPLGSSYTIATDRLTTVVHNTIIREGKKLVVMQEDDEDPYLAIKKMAEGKDFPEVFVKIEEAKGPSQGNEFSAEIEIQYILKDIGFPVVDWESKDARIHLTGKAVKEYLKKGEGVFPCKSSLEIKVVDQATGNIIVVDRQVGVAIDEDLEVAGKKSMQKAIRMVIPRLIEQMLRSLEK